MHAHPNTFNNGAVGGKTALHLPAVDHIGKIKDNPGRFIFQSEHFWDIGAVELQGNLFGAGRKRSISNFLQFRFVCCGSKPAGQQEDENLSGDNSAESIFYFSLISIVQRHAALDCIGFMITTFHLL